MLRAKLFECYIHDFDVIKWFLSFLVDLGFTDLVTHLHAFVDSAEHSVLVVQPWLQGREKGIQTFDLNLKLSTESDSHHKAS